ncbi:MAG: cyclic nucleotide-binding domain-containing protein [Chthoniobacterales bacterium]|nr:cyclic nucleotide-binding domain-containing protein [Chthoniobacterales bacterium]
MPETDFVPGLYIRDDDEGLFSRDIDGQLVRLDKPTEADYKKNVTLQIDGVPVTVPLAEPLTDANGNIVVDLAGRTTPRYTTIFDAAQKLALETMGGEKKISIPILCHQPHMRPVAVCRVCIVQIYGQKRGRRAAERKLLPACQHQVKEGMEVFTMNDPGADGERVRQTVKVVTELLAADHLKPASPPELEEEFAEFNELGQMTRRCGADPSRFRMELLSNPPPPPRPQTGRRGLDASSPVFQVDHSACILCDRCVRACDDVRENHVIGRTGKGITAGIGFDLNVPMGESTCVKCGECMVSCPTSAITFKPIARIKIVAKRRSAQTLSPRELTSDPIFAGIPPKFLLWQRGLVIRRQIRAGEVLCRQGEPGNTAFIIRSGRFKVTIFPRLPAAGGRLFHRQRPTIRERTAADVIVGEMACLSGSPRAADITALESGEVWEIRRNVLDRLMRLPSQRHRFETKYRQSSLDLTLQNTDLFRGLEEENYRQVVDYLRPRLNFVRVQPGQTLFRQGENADYLYFVRLGEARISVHLHGKVAKTVSSGPGTVLGEIGLLAGFLEDKRGSIEEIDRALQSQLNRSGDDPAQAFPPGVRTATCSALNQLELAQLARSDFLEMLRKFEVLRRRIIEQSLARLRSSAVGHRILDEYVAQGLYEGQSILVLDLDNCTRCDACTKACVDHHGTATHGIPIPRLLRAGRRLDNYMVATSCRSCTDPHCMTGCPVDSIHRGKHLQIVIEDHCIGCGLCAENCPYGSIFMIPNERNRIAVPDPEHLERTHIVGQMKAANCDLCDAAGELSSPHPACVAACPHDAAFRMTGPELLGRVRRGHGGPVMPLRDDDAIA